MSYRENLSGDTCTRAVRLATYTRYLENEISSCGSEIDRGPDRCERTSLYCSSPVERR